MYIEHEGNTFYLGLNVPEPQDIGKTSSPMIEDSPHMLTMDQIKAIAGNKATDMRAIFDKSWILNQRTHGSCAGFCGAGALSKTRYRRGQPKQMLSGAYVYSKVNGGRDRGSALEDVKNALERFGACLLSTVGWDAIYPSRQPSTADAEASRFKAVESYAVGTLQGAWTALALKFDLAVAVQVGSRFSRLDSEGVAGVDSGAGNHCVHADGVVLAKDGSTLQALGVNSWDVTFGEDGRMKLIDRHFIETMKYHMFYAIRSTTDDPNAPSPPDLEG